MYCNTGDPVLLVWFLFVTSLDNVDQNMSHYSCLVIWCFSSPGHGTKIFW